MLLASTAAVISTISKHPHLPLAQAFDHPLIYTFAKMKAAAIAVLCFILAAAAVEAYVPCFAKKPQPLNLVRECCEHSEWHSGFHDFCRIDICRVLVAWGGVLSLIA